MTGSLNKKIFSLVCIGFALIICGCHRNASKEAEIDPEKQPIHIYTVWSKSAKDIDALNNAANEAVRFCAAQKKQPEIAEYKTTYLGLTDKQKKLVEKANKEFNEYNDTTSDRDYKITVKFYCIPKDANQSMFITPREQAEQAKLEAKKTHKKP